MRLIVTTIVSWFLLLSFVRYATAELRVEGADADVHAHADGHAHADDDVENISILHSDEEPSNPDIHTDIIHTDDHTDIRTDTDFEDEVMQETILAGRGHRDEVGERDQWSSSEHLRESSRFDTRQGQAIPPKVQRKLERYRLQCDGCGHKEAVAKINAFVLDAKQEGQRAKQRQEQLRKFKSMVAVPLMSVIMCAILYWVQSRIGFGFIFGGLFISNNSTKTQVMDMEQRRAQIEERRRRAEAKEAEETLKLQIQRDNAPTWIDHEMLEVWTPKQEKQFANSLKMYGGMAPKAR
mmetsp:Transcript_25972/g.38460  ORF Transcript_25972/g.38460 Transcript_25972/m.38460 type:complete len:295 (+) Transcript_25972:77-961(+)